MRQENLLKVMVCKVIEAAVFSNRYDTKVSMHICG